MKCVEDLVDEFCNRHLNADSLLHLGDKLEDLLRLFRRDYKVFRPQLGHLLLELIKRYIFCVRLVDQCAELGSV